MSPREPVEKDMVDGLREVRKGLANLNKTLIKIAEGMDKRMDALEADLISYRKERLEEEIESHKVAIEKKSTALEKAANGDTGKIKAIASEEVKNQLGANKIDWGKLWREKLVPAGVQFIFLALLAALMVTLAPGLADVILKAFGVE